MYAHYFHTILVPMYIHTYFSNFNACVLVYIAPVQGAVIIDQIKNSE